MNIAWITNVKIICINHRIQDVECSLCIVRQTYGIYSRIEMHARMKWCESVMVRGLLANAHTQSHTRMNMKNSPRNY